MLDYIPKKRIENLHLYKYSGTDKSLVSKYILGPYWNWLVTLFPKRSRPTPSPFQVSCSFSSTLQPSHTSIQASNAQRSSNSIRGPTPLPSTQRTLPTLSFFPLHRFSPTLAFRVPQQRPTLPPNRFPWPLFAAMDLLHVGILPFRLPELGRD